MFGWQAMQHVRLVMSPFNLAESYRLSKPKQQAPNAGASALWSPCFPTTTGHRSSLHRAVIAMTAVIEILTIPGIQKQKTPWHQLCQGKRMLAKNFSVSRSSGQNLNCLFIKTSITPQVGSSIHDSLYTKQADTAGRTSVRKLSIALIPPQSKTRVQASLRSPQAANKNATGRS